MKIKNSDLPLSHMFHTFDKCSTLGASPTHLQIVIKQCLELTETELIPDIFLP